MGRVARIFRRRSETGTLKPKREGGLPFVDLKMRMFKGRSLYTRQFTAAGVAYWWWETIKLDSPTYRALVSIHEAGEWKIVESDKRMSCGSDLIRHWNDQVTIGYEKRSESPVVDGNELEQLIVKYRGY
jgi:hypothetical protein